MIEQATYSLHLFFAAIIGSLVGYNLGYRKARMYYLKLSGDRT